MLMDFQQAMADLAASPENCRALRADAGWLERRYTLGARERRQLLALVHDAGMAHACMIYRVNRLAPLAQNFDATLQALDDDMRGLLPAYWAEHPHAIAHEAIEAARFGRWLGERLPEHAPAREPLAREAARVQEALSLSLLATEALA